MVDRGINSAGNIKVEVLGSLHRKQTQKIE